MDLDHQAVRSSDCSCFGHRQYQFTFARTMTGINDHRQVGPAVDHVRVGRHALRHREPDPPAGAAWREAPRPQHDRADRGAAADPGDAAPDRPLRPPGPPLARPLRDRGRRGGGRGLAGEGRARGAGRRAPARPYPCRGRPRRERPRVPVAGGARGGARGGGRAAHPRAGRAPARPFDHQRRSGPAPSGTAPALTARAPRWRPKPATSPGTLRVPGATTAPWRRRSR